MNPLRRAHRKRAYARRKPDSIALRASLKMRIGAGFLAVCSIVMYVVQVNAISVKGFEIFEREQAITSLERENQRLELHVAQLQSTEILQQNITRLGMTADGETEYITVSSDAVAKR